MKYIKTDNFYMVEDFNNFLKANPFLDYSKKELSFRMEDIAFVRVKHFKPLSASHYEVEVHNKKEIVLDESFFAISDSTLNIISHYMLYQKFDELDLMPILRYKHFQKMMERAKTKPKDLSEKKGLIGSLFTSKTEYLIFLFNEQTQETLADYVLLDSDNQNENFLAEHAENGFYPVFFETKKLTEEIFNGFEKVMNKSIKIEKQHYYIHPYNSIGGEPLSDLEKKFMQERFLHFKRLLISKYEKLKTNYLNKTKTLDECLEAIDVSKEVFDEINDEYKEFKSKYCFEANIVAAINVLALGEYSFSKLDEMQDIYVNTLKEHDEITLKRNEYFFIVDEAVKSFREEAKNDFNV